MTSASCFDPVAGHLMLTRAQLFALAGHDRTCESSHARRTLLDLGVLDDSLRPHESLRSSVESLAAPVVVGNLERVDPEGHTGAQFWCGRDRFLLHAAAPDDQTPRELISVVPAMLPAVLVKAIGLGPRPMSARDPFLATANAVHGACLGRGTRLGGLLPEESRMWRVSWEKASESTSSVVTVLDLVTEGLWRPVEMVGEELRWVPCPVSTVWAGLSRLCADAYGRADEIQVHSSDFDTSP